MSVAVTDTAAVRAQWIQSLKDFAFHINEMARKNYLTELGQWLANRDQRAVLRLPAYPKPIPPRIVEFVLEGDQAHVRGTNDPVEPEYFDPLPPPPPPANTTDFGPLVDPIGDVYAMGPNDTQPANFVAERNGKKYRKLVTVSPFGDIRRYVPTSEV